MGSALVGPFKVPNGVKMNSVKYVEILINVIPWNKKKGVAFKQKMTFMQDYTHSTQQDIQQSP